jgi:CheY-like chemotaxis protein
MNNSNKKRILFVDDEPSVLEIVKTSLETIAGWEVIITSSPTTGIDLALTHLPDAIILDVMMPGMNGILLLKNLKTYPQLQPIPVIFLTIIVSLTEAKKFIELGAAGALVKPFNPMTLADEISQILNW